METILRDLYCRLCADLKPVNVLTNIVINTEICREVTDKLSRLDLHVNFNSKLPKTVCFECINSLVRAHDFVTSVTLAQEAFEDYDSSVFDNKNEEVSDSDATGKSIIDDVSIKTEISIPDETEVDTELLVEYLPKNKTKEKNLISKPKKTEVEPESTTLSKPVTRSQKNKTKISANDTWRDYKWLCAICDEYLPTPSELKVHSMQYHFICNPYRCFDCPDRALHMDTFVTHVTKHRPFLKLKCHKCSLKCETLKELEEHIATHFDTIYFCRGCNTTFSNEEELDNHMRTFYKNVEINPLSVTENKSLTCVLCGFTSSSRQILSRHLLLHTDRQRTHICGTCGKCFYSKKELLQHQIIHTDDRPYKCVICQYSFKNKQYLKQHAINIHFKPKKFECLDCGKHFRFGKELVVHRAIHNEVKPYKCKFCKKGFRFKHLLSQHTRIHT